MGLLDIMKLDTNSDVESSSRVLLDGEEDVVTSHLRVCYTGQEYTSVLPDAGVIRTELPSFDLPNVNPVSKKKKAPSDKDNVTSAAPSKRMKTRASKGKLPIVANDEGPHSNSIRVIELVKEFAPTLLFQVDLRHNFFNSFKVQFKDGGLWDRFWLLV
ncbi:hypothetical protein E3N88_16411 [Mikania micrantha]|uniref:Uncharacterized protein n=1 Tax=Mikania micrantha TaxID=192012 RepID=A0A5N6P010_9ASTR|nr:hypothetical protein E3N88_16411 [Mikania micrantha]